MLALLTLHLRPRDADAAPAGIVLRARVPVTAWGQIIFLRLAADAGCWIALTSFVAGVAGSAYHGILVLTRAALTDLRAITLVSVVGTRTAIAAGLANAATLASQV